MHNRYDSALRLLCIGLAALLVAQIVRVAFRADPLGKLAIPEIPTLASDSTNAPSAKGGTNAVGATNIAGVTNKAAGTNVAGATNTGSATNGVGATNVAGATNDSRSSQSTNAPGATNIAAVTNAATATNTAATGTNTTGLKTNSAAVAAGGPVPGPGVRPRGMPNMGGMPGMPGMPGAPGRPLPPLVKARLDRIIDKEILAPVMRPMPAALLGIAYQSAFLRSTNGQTGVVKVGEDVGGLKLVKIGFNRVLVEQGGQTNELTIFNGYGSESLLPKEQNK